MFPFKNEVRKLHPDSRLLTKYIYSMYCTYISR